MVYYGMTKYTYHINLDERGEFSADVRNSKGKTVYDLYPEIFEDGFMKHKYDTAGLLDYLIDMAIIPGDSEIYS